MKRIIINGANGYVASHFISELLAQKYEVIALVRGARKHSATERMKNTLDEINEYTPTKNLRIYNYSLLEENFNIPKDELKDIFSQEIDYFHFAASLKYDLKSKEEIFETNVNGIENSVQVYSRYASKGSRFFYISTAYTCGKISSPFKEVFYENDDITSFRNHYEQSKRFGENIVRKYQEKNNLNAHIIRLSQVIGNNQTGVTLTDYGIFDFAKRIHSLAYKYPNQTIRVQVNPDATQNLIPIDTVTAYLLRTVELPALPAIMNFIAKKQIKNKDILSNLSGLIPINIIPDMELRQNDMNALERLISIGMSFTGSYSNVNITFETKNLDSILITEVDQPSKHTIFNMLEYFINKLKEKKKDRIYALA